MLTTAAQGGEGGEAASPALQKPRQRKRSVSGVDTAFELMDSAGIGNGKKSQEGCGDASPNW